MPRRNTNKHTMKHIVEVAESIGLTEDDLEFYGRYKAKIDYMAVLDRLTQKAAMRLSDQTLLRQIIEKDDDEMVCLAAQERLAAITREKVTVDA